MGQSCDKCDKCQDFKLFQILSNKDTCETQDEFCKAKKEHAITNYMRTLEDDKNEHVEMNTRLVSVHADLKEEESRLGTAKDELIYKLANLSTTENFWNFGKQHNECTNALKTCTQKRESLEACRKNLIALKQQEKNSMYKTLKQKALAAAREEME